MMNSQKKAGDSMANSLSGTMRAAEGGMDGTPRKRSRRRRPESEQRAEDCNRAQRPDRQQQAGHQKVDAGRAAAQREIGEKRERDGLIFHALQDSLFAAPGKEAAPGKAAGGRAVIAALSGCCRGCPARMRRGARDFDAFVAGPVIDDQELEIAMGPGENALHGRRKERGGIAHRHQHRYASISSCLQPDLPCR
jgi:hypothetical protein